MDAQPLTDRSTNTHLGTAEETGKPINSMDYHRQKLQGKLESGESNQASYVSPSDELMSPCSKKLSDLKGKRFKNAGKPQSLFAKLGKKNFEQSAAAEAQREKENAESAV
ncbi:Spo12 family protein [Aspergillus saccharolyticus JOP 1030-1]|uniref:Spo12 family protein n=1 Tax=Aspergillus saccharolyticus JOP 1030-1 TaxID=1450539 RepID=A0A318Z3Z4_9EURO|nr:hypothetical protein BP01DRAFT_359826 [Aspergillus saccharolyticus JOP 1030-1]PYH42035.1 hypothetical protein BP01DRAFT_359826 [Aspergillus saccharolyticus JOP 1030-1]